MHVIKLTCWSQHQKLAAFLEHDYIFIEEKQCYSFPTFCSAWSISSFSKAAYKAIFKTCSLYAYINPANQ